MNESLAKDALRTIKSLERRIAELETELAKSRGTTPVDRSGLKGSIADAAKGGLRNSFAVKGVDTGDLVTKAYRGRKGSK